MGIGTAALPESYNGGRRRRVSEVEILLYFIIRILSFTSSYGGIDVCPSPRAAD